MQRRAKKELFGPHMIVIAMLVARKRLVEDFENLHLTFCYLLFSDHFSEFFTSPILVQTISLSPLYLWSVHCNPSQVQRRSLVGSTACIVFISGMRDEHFKKLWGKSQKIF